MSELGKRGGAVRSEAKTRAARKNGRKGGRPRKHSEFWNLKKTGRPEGERWADHDLA